MAKACENSSVLMVNSLVN